MTKRWSIHIRSLWLVWKVKVQTYDCASAIEKSFVWCVYTTLPMFFKHVSVTTWLIYWTVAFHSQACKCGGDEHLKSDFLVQTTIRKWLTCEWHFSPLVHMLNEPATYQRSFSSPLLATTPIETPLVSHSLGPLYSMCLYIAPRFCSTDKSNTVPNVEYLYNKPGGSN